MMLRSLNSGTLGRRVSLWVLSIGATWVAACGGDHTNPQAETSGAPFTSPIAHQKPVHSWTDSEREQFCAESLAYILNDEAVRPLLCHVDGVRSGDCASYAAGCRAPVGYATKCFVNNGAGTCTATSDELAACVTAEAERLRRGEPSCSTALDTFLADPADACRTPALQDCEFVPVSLE